VVGEKKNTTKKQKFKSTDKADDELRSPALARLCLNESVAIVKYYSLVTDVNSSSLTRISCHLISSSPTRFHPQNRKYVTYCVLHQLLHSFCPP
jgi:hypothetical protein